MFSFAKKWVDKLDGHPANTSDSYFNGVNKINNNGYGLRVLKVAPRSQAAEAGLEPWFDYIVKINGFELPMAHDLRLSSASYSINDDGSINYGVNKNRASLVDLDILTMLLRNSANGPDKQVTFDIWSAKGGQLKQVKFKLDSFVNGGLQHSNSVHQISKDCFAELGLVAQSVNVETATYVWRILNTHPGSPAFKSQLVPYTDYIIGCDSAFPSHANGKGLLAQGGESLLLRTISAYYADHRGAFLEDAVPITLYVYNLQYDVVRPVTVNLSKAWSAGGQKGILGCDVGYGFLHRVPSFVALEFYEAPQLPGETTPAALKGEDATSLRTATDAPLNSEPLVSAEGGVPAVPAVPKQDNSSASRAASKYTPAQALQTSKSPAYVDDPIAFFDQLGIESAAYDSEKAAEDSKGEPESVEKGSTELNALEIADVDAGVSREQTTNAGIPELKVSLEQERTNINNQQSQLNLASETGEENSMSEVPIEIEEPQLVSETGYLDIPLSEKADQSAEEPNLEPNLEPSLSGPTASGTDLIRGHSENNLLDSDTSALPQNSVNEAVQPGLGQDTAADFLNSLDDDSFSPYGTQAGSGSTPIPRDSVSSMQNESLSAPSDVLADAVGAVQAPVALPSRATLSPSVNLAFGLPPRSPRAKRNSAQRRPVPTGLGNLTDYMNEELSKSKAKDVIYGETNGNLPPPPPPKLAK